GSKFPAPPASFPGKDEMADYLEAYSRSGGLPVRTGVRAVKLARSDGSYVMETTSGVMKAAHVVVATGYQKPKLPPFAAGLKRAPRVTAVEGGLPICEDGRRMEPGTIVWCTGFTRDYSWIEFPVAGPDGYPRHTGGVAEGESGLYFVGLPFQTRLASG